MKTVKFTPEVGAILARSTVEANIVRLPDGQLDRALYSAVDKVLKALGGKWHTGKRGHVFAAGIGDELAGALAAGHVVDLKKTHEQFFTPPELASRMAAMLDLKPGMSVLEPSAGAGALIQAVIDVTGTGAGIFAYEIDQQLRDELRGNFFRCFGGGGLGVDCMTGPEPKPVFDRVIMNPPFSKNQDIRHTLRAWEKLKPGGRLVAIMSPHSAFAEDRESREFRQWLARVNATVEDLPEGTFKASGTMVRARLIYAEKQL